LEEEEVESGFSGVNRSPIIDNEPIFKPEIQEKDLIELNEVQEIQEEQK
jgi:hypothetical protein